jgi:hypothetical protein
MTANALRLIDGGDAPDGWEALWAKDEWHQRELPHGDLATTYDREVVLRFGRLAQPWLKEAAKRWARTRLLSSLSARSMERYLRELMEFSRWLARRDVASPAEITRQVLEDYLLYVRTQPWAQATRRRRLGALRAFLDEQRDDGLARLPRSAVIHFAEMPRPAEARAARQRAAPHPDPAARAHRASREQPRAPTPRRSAAGIRRAPLPAL